VALLPRQMEGAAAKLQEEDGAHSGQRSLACIQWDSGWRETKWCCAPGRQRGQQPSSRGRMGPTWVRDLWLASSGTVSGAGPSGAMPRQMEGAAAKLQEEDGAHSGQRALACIQGAVSRVGPSGAAYQIDRAARLQEEGGAHLGQRALACIHWDSEWSRTKWHNSPGRWRGQWPSSRRRMGPTLVRELGLVSSGTVSGQDQRRMGPTATVGIEESVTNGPSTHSSSLLVRPGEGNRR